MIKSLKIILFSFLCFAAFSCKTTDFSNEFQNQNTKHFVQNQSDIYISKIDLDTPNLQIKIIVSPEVFFLSEFKQGQQLDFAINTTPYSFNGNNIRLLGVAKYGQNTLAEPVEKYSALTFYFQNNSIRGQIIKNQNPQNIANSIIAAGGYFQILDQGQIQPFLETKRSRSACGLSEDGRYLYLLTVISRRFSDKSGLSYKECAQLLLNEGCYNALEFDGGHSTQAIIPEYGFVKTKNPRKIPAALGFSNIN